MIIQDMLTDLVIQMSQNMKYMKLFCPKFKNDLTANFYL